METIQVPGGTQEEYVRHAQSRKDAGLDKISLVLRWVSGIIIFIAVIIAAGIRGYSAYHHSPAIQVNFQARPSIPFPAVTVCPLSPSTLTIIECIKETANNIAGDCSASVYTQTYNVDGVTFTCLEVNDQTTPLASNSVNDLMEIEVSINTSAIIQGEPIGVFVILHQQGVQPEVEVESSFVASGGQFTQVIMALDEVHFVNGGQENDYVSSTSSAIVQETISGTYANIAAIAFGFTAQGAFINQEYYVYTVNTWIGEIGGLAFLLYMLHWAFCGILLLIYGRLKRT